MNTGLDYAMHALRANSAATSSARSGMRKPAESRRWLKRRITKEQLHRLAPGRPKPKRLGMLDCWDRIRGLARAWWVWLALTLGLLVIGNWHFALLAGALSFI